MKITTITFERTIQVKQYEPAHWTATITCDDGDDPKEALAQVKRLINEDVKATQERIAAAEEARRAQLEAAREERTRNT